MTQILETDTMELIYSPDDNGYYWQRFSDWKISQIFFTENDAIRAKQTKQLIWD